MIHDPAFFFFIKTQYMTLPLLGVHRVLPASLVLLSLSLVPYRMMCVLSILPTPREKQIKKKTPHHHTLHILVQQLKILIKQFKSHWQKWRTTAGRQFNLFERRYWWILFSFKNAFLCENVRCERSLHFRLWKKPFVDGQRPCYKGQWQTARPVELPWHVCLLLDHKQWFPFFCTFTCIPKHTRFPKSSFMLIRAHVHAHTHNSERPFIIAEGTKYLIQAQLWASISPPQGNSSWLKMD